MNRMLQTVCVVAAGILLLAACAKDETGSYTATEQIALQKWMQINRPELLENFQAEGGYYVDVLEQGSADAKPIRDTATWVRFTFTGRNLAGDIVLTRDEIDARQIGSYTKFTHYVPYYKYYGGKVNTSLLEGTFLSMHNRLLLGEKYAADRSLPRIVDLRCGSKVTLYMPSSIVSTGGVSGSGGYEGQSGYELNSGVPFVVTMEITDTVRNPIQREGVNIEAFAKDNGKLLPVPKKNMAPVYAAPGIIDPDPYKDGFGWHYANDSIPHVIVNLTLTPQTKYNYANPYLSIYAPYSAFDKLEQDICDTLVNRFGSYPDGPHKLPKDSVSLKGTAKIWYIGRFLDGFIFDSNIPGVRRLVYGETSTTGTPLSYTPESGGMIEAFYYTIPNLRYGQWCGILSISTYAYGATGVSGTSSTTSSNQTMDYYNYMNQYNYMNGAYGGYMGGYYGYTPYSNTGTTTTTSSISTEIPAYTPLLFEVYIEPKAE